MQRYMCSAINHEKTFRDRGSGFKDYCPIDYGTTVTKLLPREIKP